MTYATMDRAGRLVMPKQVRDQLHLKEGARFEVQVVADRVQFVPVEDVSGIKLVKKGKLPVITGLGAFDAAESVRAVREQLTRRGSAR